MLYGCWFEIVFLLGSFFFVGLIVTGFARPPCIGSCFFFVWLLGYESSLSMLRGVCMVVVV